MDMSWGQNYIAYNVQTSVMLEKKMQQQAPQLQQLEETGIGFTKLLDVQLVLLNDRFYATHHS